MQATRHLGTRHGPLLAAPLWSARGGSLAHAGLVVALSLFIALGPAAGQIFGMHCAVLREWVMFSGSGIGVLKGRFVLHHAQGPDQVMTPLELLGLRHYPDAPPDEFDRLVFEDADLKTAAAAVCRQHTDMSRLSFHGWVGTRQGWRPLDVDDVCAMRGDAMAGRTQGEGPPL